jgi:hypothetical protein
MMAADRDPRLDPKPGDVLRYVRGLATGPILIERRVYRVTDERVFWTSHGVEDGGTVPGEADMEDWRALMARGEVVRVGGEGA